MYDIRNFGITTIVLVIYRYHMLVMLICLTKNAENHIMPIVSSILINPGYLDNNTIIALEIINIATSNIHYRGLDILNLMTQQIYKYV